MDFHSLARKELQALCKKNKIPANITNVAMADALQALQHVEGLEEILNPSNSVLSKSTVETVIGLPDIPRTACRTSTRRKTIKQESEISETLTRSRRGTNGRITKDIDQENNEANAPMTPAGLNSRRRAPAASACRNIEKQLKEDDENEKIKAQGRNDVAKTPAITSSRRRAPTASAQTKLKTQNGDTSVQRVYSTRRSVRLLERNMEKLSIIENGKEETAKVDDLFEEPGNTSERPEVSVEPEKNISGVNKQTRSEVDSEKNDALEVSLDPKSIGSPETQRELEVDVKDKDKSDDEYEVDASDEALNEGSDESYNISSEKLEALIGVNVEAVDEKGPVDVPITEQDRGSLGTVAVEVPEHNIDHNLVPDENAQDECQNLTCKDSDMNVAEVDDIDSSDSEYATEGSFDGDIASDENSTDCEDDISDDDATTLKKDSEALVLPKDQMMDGFRKLETKTEFLVGVKKSKEASDQLDTKYDSADGLDLGGDLTIDNDSPSESFVAQQFEMQVSIEFSEKVSLNGECIKAPCPVQSPVSKIEVYDSEALVDIHKDSSLLCLATQSSKEGTPFHTDNPMSKVQENIQSENLANVNPVHESTSVKKVIPDVIPDTKITCKSQPFQADQLSGQFPRPTHLTLRKSPALEQTQKMFNVSDEDEDEEGIDNGSEIEELNKDKARQDENTVNKDVMLETMSLRKLRQMLIQQSKGNNKGKSMTKEQSGKKRIALQTLQENCLAMKESNKGEYEVPLGQ